MVRKIIIFLVRARLGLKKYQQFRFSNQKSKTDTYYFGTDFVYKMIGCNVVLSDVSLNWLIDPRCEIVKLDKIG